jgi:hypothetical protein
LRNLFASILVLASAPAFAGERYLGTIVATTTKNNTDTASPFGIPAGAKLSVQCDATAFVLVCQNAAGCSATSTNGIKLTADQLFTTSTPSSPSGVGLVAVVSPSGTANCRVFERAGNEG